VHSSLGAADPGALRAYAEAAARLQGLELPEEWWGPVLVFFDLALSQAELVARAPAPTPVDLAPVFVP
jgi:hypothetical protein